MPPQGASGQTPPLRCLRPTIRTPCWCNRPTPSPFPTCGQCAANQYHQPAGLARRFQCGRHLRNGGIASANTNFVAGQVTVGSAPAISRCAGFGADPTHLVADVVVANNASIGAWPVNVISGFQVAEQPAAFQVQPPNTNLPTPALPYLRRSYATVLHDADYGSIFGSNLAMTPTSAQVLLNGVAAPVLYASPTQINFQIPAGFPWVRLLYR